MEQKEKDKGTGKVQCSLVSCNGILALISGVFFTLFHWFQIEYCRFLGFFELWKNTLVIFFILFTIQSLAFLSKLYLSCRVIVRSTWITEMLMFNSKIFAITLPVESQIHTFNCDLYIIHSFLNECDFFYFSYTKFEEV